jgi:hypothetical protein
LISVCGLLLLVKKMRAQLIFIMGLFLSVQSWAQQKELRDLCNVFNLPDGKDTTTFVVFGNQADLKVKKPLFLFRQGSQPMPIIHQYQDGYYMPVSPFRFRDYKGKYHFVMISKPGVRLIADSVYLDQYQKAMSNGDTSEVYVSKKYLQNNYREKYVEQCDRVIDFLVKQPWVDSNKVVFCGGSEGFTVGADLVGNRNKHITHAILFSGNPERRLKITFTDCVGMLKTGLLQPRKLRRKLTKCMKCGKISVTILILLKNPLAILTAHGTRFQSGIWIIC